MAVTGAESTAVSASQDPLAAARGVRSRSITGVSLLRRRNTCDRIQALQYLSKAKSADSVHSLNSSATSFGAIDVNEVQDLQQDLLRIFDAASHSSSISGIDSNKSGYHKSDDNVSNSQYVEKTSLEAGSENEMVNSDCIKSINRRQSSGSRFGKILRRCISSPDMSEKREMLYSRLSQGFRRTNSFIRRKPSELSSPFTEPCTLRLNHRLSSGEGLGSNFKGGISCGEVRVSDPFEHLLEYDYSVEGRTSGAVRDVSICKPLRREIEIRKPRLSRFGVKIILVNEEVYVLCVKTDSSAYKAGLGFGDRIVAIADKDISQLGDLQNIAQFMNSSSYFSLNISDKPLFTNTRMKRDSILLPWGFSVTQNSNEIINVVSGSPADMCGLKKGQCLIEIEGRNVMCWNGKKIQSIIEDKRTKHIMIGTVDSEVINEFKAYLQSYIQAEMKKRDVGNTKEEQNKRNSPEIKSFSMLTRASLAGSAAVQGMSNSYRRKSEKNNTYTDLHELSLSL